MARFHARLAVLGSAAALAVGALASAPLAGAETSAAAAYQWVAVGDSYTAGVIRAAGDVFEVPRDGCERTDQSYPMLIDRDLGSLVDLTNRSCGGAALRNVTSSTQEPTGQHRPPISEDPDYPFPAVAPQSAGVNPRTDVITVGAGGNTLGFADILLRCLQLGGESGGVGTPCRDKLADDIPSRLHMVSRDYDEMLTALHERAPQAKILAVGYPTVIPTDTAKCRYNDLEQFGPITRGDLDWLREDVLEALNTVIEKSAGAHDATRFVDLYDSSRKHSVCDTGNWMEGIFTHVPHQPALVHPNAQGHRNAADHVTAAMLEAIAVG